MIKLGPLRREDMPQLLNWRNQTPEAWRDPRPTTITQQLEWFDGPVSHGPGWYWGIYGDAGNLIGQSEITNLYTGSGEIGLIIHPVRREAGIGREAVMLTLLQGFRYLGLEVIRGECYECNSAWGFWQKLAEEWGGWYDETQNKKRTDDGIWWGAIDFGWLRNESLGKIENTRL